LDHSDGAEHNDSVSVFNDCADINNGRNTRSDDAVIECFGQEPVHSDCGRSADDNIDDRATEIGQ
jgi:hypothetical protein